MTVEEQLSDLMRERSSAAPHDLDRAVLRARIKARHRTRLALSATAVIAAALVPVVAVDWLAPGPPPPLPPAASALGICVADPQTLPAGLLLATLHQGGGLTTVGTDPAHAGALLLSVNGKVTTLPGVPPQNSFPKVVNASGVVAGTTNYQPAWVVRDGHYRELPVPGWTVEVVVTGINARGDLVGFVGDTSGQRKRALVWPAAAPGTVRELATPDGWKSTAAAITDSGVIVGELQDTATEQLSRPYRWSVDGSGTALPDPPIDPSPSSGPIAPQVHVLAANGDWILGSRGVRWNLRTGRADTYTAITPELIDQQGRIYGVDGTGRPAIWVNGVVQLLTLPNTNPRGTFHFTSVDATHALGAVLTIGSDLRGTRHYTLWTCGR